MRNTMRFTLLLLLIFLTGCQSTQPQAQSRISTIQVLASDSILADVTRNIAGDRVVVEYIIPLGVDPHSFEPTPKDVSKIQQSRLLIFNSASYEIWLGNLINRNDNDQIRIEASKGLPFRAHDEENVSGSDSGEDSSAHHEEGDPHFWMDPVLMKTYVINIRDGLIQIDPQGKDVYETNAEKYNQRLDDLHEEIMEMVSSIPKQERILVTNHESFGYFADEYGFSIIGTIIPGASSGASPSARELVSLIGTIKSSNAPAIFIEAGSNPDIADQIAQESQVKVVTGLIIHSLTQTGGEADSYLEMIRYNTRLIVEALK